ncbi:MAG: hypothetical protein IKP75_09750, partial [Oscillospiraceae bacterium]|nr:hypothetical protein [Oscillospiraceae bacterium]
FTNSEYYAIIILKSINNKTDGKPVIPLLTYTFGTYIQDNYITLLLLSALIIMLIGNWKMKISGTNYEWLIIGITLAITVLQAVELMCDRYGWSHRILYYKCAATYWLYPLAAMLELYLVAPIKHKFLMAIPYAVNFTLQKQKLCSDDNVEAFHKISKKGAFL